MDPWGMYAAGKKEKNNEPRGERLVGCKARTESTTGDPWEQVQTSKKKRGQAGTVGGLGSQSGSTIWDLRGSQQEADGLQRAT